MSQKCPTETFDVGEVKYIPYPLLQREEIAGIASFLPVIYNHKIDV